MSDTGAPHIDVSYSVASCPGDVDISERGCQKEGLWTVVKLVERIGDIRLSVWADDDGIRLTLEASHVENEATGRAFHASLEFPLSGKILDELYRFLGLLTERRP